MGIITPKVLSESAKATEKKRKKVRRPGVDLGACTMCGGCLEVAPVIFRFCEAGGFLEVCDLDYYDPELVDEAIKFCPEDCIYWEDDETGSD
jgi:ferredoxin